MIVPEVYEEIVLKALGIVFQKYIVLPVAQEVHHSCEFFMNNEKALTYLPDNCFENYFRI